MTHISFFVYLDIISSIVQDSFLVTPRIVEQVIACQKCRFLRATRAFFASVHKRVLARHQRIHKHPEEASQPPEVLAGEGVIGWGEEVAGRPPEVLAGEGGGRPAEGGCRPPA